MVQTLLVIRHAVAHERDTERWPDDDDRPLTRQGVKKFRRVSAVLGKLVPKPDEVLCSPLVRTRQTAKILRKVAEFPRFKRCRALRPEAPTDRLIKELARCSGRCVAIVGHEPGLSVLLSVLLGVEDRRNRWRMKKGALAWLKINGPLKKGTATLVAYLPPRLSKLH